jgi:hypothetical protein
MTKAKLLRRIRLKCLDCACNQIKEVTLCPVETCTLYPLRTGKDPTKRTLSPERKEALVGQLRKARE